MDMNQLLGLLQIYPPSRPVWPGHDLPERGRVWEGTGNLFDAPWDQRQGRTRTLEMPQADIPPEMSARYVGVPTEAQTRPSFNPGLRIGGNEAAQVARAARERRSTDLMRLLDVYNTVPGKEKWL